jgi:hypothetical protein
VEGTYGYTGEKTGLGDPEKDACDKQTMVVLNNAHKCHDDTPRDHDCRKPDAWTKLLEEQIRGDFEGGIREEEDGETPVVLIRTHVEILLKAFNLCIADVTS